MATSTKTWSSQQQAVFNWFEARDFTLGGISHAIVRARAGTGKTTTIIEGVNRMPERSILLAAFNKRIADELTTRLTNPRAVAKTLHAIGFALVRDAWKGVRVANDTRDRADYLTSEVCKAARRNAPDAVQKLITKLHTKGREIAPHARELGDLTELLDRFECTPDEEWVAAGFDDQFVETMALAAMDLAGKVKPVAGIDFADMIFLPLRNHWLKKTYDAGVVDEAQDMTPAQLELFRGVVKGRICVVGDDRQAIYAFRGADSEALDRLKTELNATEFPLTVTYRCGTTIVDLAKTLVPDFEAGPMNPAGTVERLIEAKLVATADLGDFILSRLNAPLVTVAMGLLRTGKRARIAGRDIGAGLKALVRKLAKGRAQHDITVFVERLATWRDQQLVKFMAAGKEAKVELINDQFEMIMELVEASQSPREVEDRIDALFTDDGLGQAGVITCSSVHRAKGLEANRVFVLEKTLRSANIEELNIQYVAYTRAKATLVLVGERKGAEA